MRADSVNLAVTTRSRLKSTRFFVPMLRASLGIRRQLEQTSGCVRFASIVTRPREFWTISAWRSRHEMQQFMRSGAHDVFMWNFAHWFDSFWLMRWSPTSDEHGSWAGLELANGRRNERQGAKSPPGNDVALTAAFGSIPKLLASVGPRGAPAFGYAPEARRHRRRVAGGIGVTVRIEVKRPSQAIAALSHLRSLKREIVVRNDALGCVIGLASPKEIYALAVLRNPHAWRELHSSHALGTLLNEWADSAWAMRWDAQHEFGHWDGARLRHIRFDGRSMTGNEPP